VLISCNAGIRAARERQERQARDAHLADILDQDGLGPFVAWWERSPALSPARPLPRAVEEELRSRRLNQDPHGLADALHCLGAGAMDDLWPRLGALRLPVLLIAGSADRRYVGLMGEMAALIPGARLAEVPGSGHAVHREQPEALRAVVGEFLRG
jgi:2-succinyl-6-hydroxy-2,4-cyclohexadiene-1-carboxylate synthase